MFGYTWNHVYARWLNAHAVMILRAGTDDAVTKPLYDADAKDALHISSHVGCEDYTKHRYVQDYFAQDWR